MLGAKHLITLINKHWIAVAVTILAVFLASPHSQAQTSSQKGWFTVNFDAGCFPLDITLTNTGLRPGALFVDFMGDAGDPFSNIGFTNTFNPTETLTTTYSSAGTFLIRVVDQSGAGAIEDRFDFIEINVLEATAPVYTTALCNNNRVVLTFDFGQDSYDFYEIDFGDGTPVTVFDKSGSSETAYTYAVQGNYTIQVSGKLNTGSDINCGNSPPQMISTIQSIPTPQITMLTMLDEQTVEVTYETLTENINYELLLKIATNPFNSVANIDPVANSNTFSYTLSSPIANIQDLQFQLGAVEACGVVQNFSNIVRNVRTFYSADYLNGNELTISSSWFTDHTAAELTGVNFVFDGTPESVNTAPSGEYRKILANCIDVRPYYYEVTLNGAVSRSITLLPDFSINGLSPPRTSGLQGRLAGAAVILTYDEAPVPTGEYRIYRSTPTARDLAGTTTGLIFTVEDFELTDSEVCFVVTYVDDCGFESVPTEEICFEFSPVLRLPNAFSPNGDSHNDTFGVPTGVYPDFQMLIFNRWGRMVYSSNSPSQHWDGFINGQAAPIGSYVYRINYNFTPNSPVSLTGSITLIR
ncbi:MAG: gliding motility-associated C-terminal domain-containing protein [Roseivirga sp.]|nr:gliding motility-associated C-terminal domain-containing protein [Roseivirga sp.]